MEWLNGRLDLEKLRAIRQVAVSLFRDKHDIFKAYPTDAEVVEPRLYSDHMPLSQGCFNGSDPRRFMNIQAQAVSRTVKKSLHSPFDPPRWETSRLEPS